MPIERVKRPLSAARLQAAAENVLDAAPLCAIATVGPRSHAHINTAYFAWSRAPIFELVWLSEPGARHSRNVRANRTVAVAVYDSAQSWGKPDRGLQLFGSARELENARAVRSAAALYAKRFPDYREPELSAYRFYRFRPRRLKLFDELALGAGTFVTAKVHADGRLTWEQTEVYRPAG